MDAVEPPGRVGAEHQALPSPPDGVALDVRPGGDVCVLTLDRPAVRNAQTPAMWDGLRRLGDQLSDSIRVVVVRATGPTFSAGLDRSVFTSTDADGMPALAAAGTAAITARIAEFQDAFTWLTRPAFVSIAAVQGHAVGAGFQLALACDLRVVADDAVFRMAEISLGLVPDLGGTKRLVDLVGPARALDICATARDVPATEALAIGLANRLAPAAHLDTAVDDLIDALLAKDPAALRAVTALIASASGNTHADQQAAERQAQAPRLQAALTPR